MSKINYKAGLVINTKGTNIYSNIISMGYGDYWTHTLWIREVIEDRLFIQEADGKNEKKIISYWVNKVYFDELYNKNLIKIMDFGIDGESEKFKSFCKSIEGIKYDYFSIFKLTISRLLILLNVEENIIDKFLRNEKIDKKLKKLNFEYKSVNKLDCSELIAFGLYSIKDININKELNLVFDEKVINKWDYIRPQHISLLYDKINLKKTDVLNLVEEELFDDFKRLKDSELPEPKVLMKF